MNRRNIIKNSLALIMTACGLLLCMAGKAQDMANVWLSADSSEKITDMGFYSLPEIAVTGSVATVTGKSLMRPVSQLSMALPGQLVGLQTQESQSEPTNVFINKYIRGFSSMNGADPLIIVDGMINSFYNIIDFLHPEEIETISIVKDGSSLAVYGIQGANGAIVITTKRGVAGSAKVNAWYHSSLMQMTKRPEFVGSAQYAQLRNEAGANSGLGAFSQFTQAQIDKFASKDDPLYPDNNWYDMFVGKNMYMQQAGISVQGGDAKTRYYSVINYQNISSPFVITHEPGRKYDPTPRVDRATIRTNFDVKFNSYLNAFLLLNGVMNVDQRSPHEHRANYSWIFNVPPTMYGPLTPEETSDDGETSPQSNQAVIYTNGAESVYGLLNRSGFCRRLNTTVQAQTGVTLDMGFLTEGLSLGGIMAYQMYGANLTYTTQEYERYIRSNDFSVLDFTKSGTAENTPLGYGKAYDFYYYLNLSARAVYRKTFGDHSLNASAFYYYGKREIMGDVLPYKNEMAGVTALYGYQDKYFVKADLGYSGSEQFHPDYRYIATPAISAAWVVSRENFLTGLDWLTLLKLRASYGINANDQLGGDRFLYADYVRSSGAEGLRGNPRLSAEKIKKQNYGIDVELFGSVSLSIDRFYHRCDNMLISDGMIPVYQTIPLQYYPKLNNGKMENHGIEIDAGYNGRLTRDLSLFAGAGFGFTRNKVIQINELPYDDRYYPRRTEGFRRGQQWGYLIDYDYCNGIFDSQAEIIASELTYSTMVTPRVGDFIYSDLNKDKVIDEGDVAPIGYATLPEVFYSFRGGVQWKDFDVSFLMQGVTNASVTVSGVGAYENAAQGVFSDMHLNAWTPERYAAGEKTDYPALSLTPSANHVANSFFIMDASYLKLRNVEIGYTLPVSLARKIKAENVRFSLSGQNLFTIDRMRSKYIDPETGSMSAFQPYRVYSAGIKCTF